MRSGTARITRLAVRFGGMAALLLAIGMLGAPAPAHDDARPPQAKDRPNPAKGKDETPKKDEPKKDEPKKDDPKSAAGKLGLSINDSRAFQGYTLISPF